MSEPKAQLVDPQENMNLPGMNATGVITASSFSGSGGVVTGLTGGGNLNVGVVTATSFVGDGTGHAANLTGTPNLNLGLTTATSFVGDATGKAAGLTGTPNLNVGLITATSFAGAVTGDVTGNITGLAGSITPGNNLNVGVATGIQWHGDGSALTGAGSSAFIAQEITASSAETIIDLSYGNLIYLTQDTDGAQTTVGFASTSPAEQLTIIRNPDTSSTKSWNISYSTGGVDFDDTGDYLNTTSASSDFTMGTGDFTVECWVYIHDVGTISGFWQISNTSGGLATDYGDTLAVAWDHQAGEGWQIYGAGTYSKTGLTVSPPSNNEWIHTAYVRSSGTSTLYIDGTAVITQADTHDYDGTYIAIGGYYNTGYLMDGVISNFRVLKGTALYTTNFSPPSAALTNITNTKLLCLQSDSSTTAAAVTPQTLNAQGDPTAGAQTITNTGALPVTYSITWPDRVKWNNDTTPTLFNNNNPYAVSNPMQIFRFTTVDTGLTYNAWEEMKNSGSTTEWWSWGYFRFGSKGDNENPSDPKYSSPVQVAGGKYFDTVSGDFASLGIVDGTLWAWGYNVNGALGQNEGGNPASKSSPCQIPGTNWSAGIVVNINNSAMSVTKTDGTLWQWGSNEYGELGQNSKNDDQSSPVQVGTDTNWNTSVGGIFGGYITFAFKTDGTLWGWGYNGDGALGINNRTQYSSPAQIPGTNYDTGFRKNSGTGSRASIKTDGTLWVVGNNTHGQLGVNNTTKYSSPVQVGTDTTWDKCSAAGPHAYIKTDGTLWICGDNSDGECGQNDTTHRSSPVQVPGTTWSDVMSGSNKIAATKTDGTLWTWGDSEGKGYLGLNQTTIKISSPTQIPGTNWTMDNVIGSTRNKSRINVFRKV